MGWDKYIYIYTTTNISFRYSLSKCVLLILSVCKRSIIIDTRKNSWCRPYFKFWVSCRSNAAHSFSSWPRRQCVLRLCPWHLGVGTQPHPTTTDGVDAVPLAFIRDKPDQPRDYFVIANTDSFDELIGFVYPDILTQVRPRLRQELSRIYKCNARHQ